MKHLGDITKINGAEIEPVDCITGGSPCQDLSIAGNRAGLAGERSGLFMEQVRIIKEMRDATRAAGAVKPRWMVWENVPGAFSSNGGKDFQAVLTEIVKIIEPDSPDVPMPDKGKWAKAGCLYDEMGRWSIAWRVHDAQFWGVPQRRKRIALVADFGGLSAPEICFERKGLRRDIKESGTERKGVAEGTKTGVESAISFQERAGKPGGGKGILIQRERIGALSTLNNQAVYDARGNGDGNTSPTLTGDHENRVTDYTALCVGNGQICNISMKPLANTLDTMHDQQAVLVAVDCRNGTENETTNGTLQAKSTGGTGVNFQNVVRIDQLVRRLTPTECERLQGYPGGWTDIGEWTDSKGKRHKPADSPRYKALGNSIALPFWFYLLRRISAQYERPATLGSLFDGIGGFPLCWERCNGKGTARWASEIEEFPIAVTKNHFGEE